jgi:hypothetical protein
MYQSISDAAHSSCKQSFDIVILILLVDTYRVGHMMTRAITATVNNSDYKSIMRVYLRYVAVSYGSCFTMTRGFLTDLGSTLSALQSVSKRDRIA